ncbi:MAG: hypothetical protein AAF318_02080 [Pseudomonadota bacterium]
MSSCRNAERDAFDVAAFVFATLLTTTHRHEIITTTTGFVFESVNRTTSTPSAWRLEQSFVALTLEWDVRIRRSPYSTSGVIVYIRTWPWSGSSTIFVFARGGSIPPAVIRTVANGSTRRATTGASVTLFAVMAPGVVSRR